MEVSSALFYSRPASRKKAVSKIKGDKENKTTKDQPEPNFSEIVKAVNALHPPGSAVELCWFPVGKPYPISEPLFFDAEELAHRAVRINRNGGNCHIQLNTIDVERRFKAKKDRPTSRLNSDCVSSIRWIFIDIDPEREDGLPASVEQFNEARRVAKQVYETLRSFGWPDPIMATSGNGIHLLYPADLHPREKEKRKIKLVLHCLNKATANNTCTVDTATFDPPRMVRLYGTVNRKYEGTHERPQRLAKLHRPIDRIIRCETDCSKVVQLDQIDAVIASCGRDINPEPERPFAKSALPPEQLADRDKIDLHMPSWIEMLEGKGWKYTGRSDSVGTLWTRPGKEQSARLSKSGKTFRVFSSSTDFEEKGYSKREVYAKFFHDGDIENACRHLRKLCNAEKGGAR